MNSTGTKKDLMTQEKCNRPENKLRDKHVLNELIFLDDIFLFCAVKCLFVLA